MRPDAPLCLRLLLVTLFACTAFLVACNAIILTQMPRRIHDATTAPNADAILILGARVFDDGSVSRVLADRLEVGIELFNAGKAPRIIVSGDSRSSRNDEVQAMVQYLLDRGLPASAIVQDGAGFDTYSSVVRAKVAFGVNHALVVSQAVHLPRALFIARWSGLEADGVSANLRKYRFTSTLQFAVHEVFARVKACIDVARRRSPKSVTP